MSCQQKYIYHQGLGVIGVQSGDSVLRMFPGALSVLQAIHSGKYPGAMRLATASTADTPLCVDIARAAIAILEIVPGIVCQLLRICINQYCSHTDTIMLLRTH